MLAPKGQYYNYSGCGNTLNCNHPQVRRFILECLQYWVLEMHVDGFRFDLASIMTRAPSLWHDSQEGAPALNGASTAGLEDAEEVPSPGRLTSQLLSCSVHEPLESLGDSCLAAENREQDNTNDRTSLVPVQPAFKDVA